MTITAYTTGNVTAETMANALVVMEAYRATGDQLMESFGTNKNIQANGQTEEGGIKFTADLSGLSRAVTISVNNGPAFDVAVNKSVTDEVKPALVAATKSAPTPAKPQAKPAPKR